MKVLHVCETMLGGVGTYQNELVSLQQGLWGVERVRFLGPQQDLVQVPDIAPASIDTFFRRSRLAGLPNLAWAFVRVVRSFRPDVIHVHSTFAGLIVRFIAPFFGIPVLYCPHGWAIDRYRSSFVQKSIALIESMLARVSAGLIAVSEAERRRGIASGIDPQKITVILNGLRSSPPAFQRVEWQDQRLKVLFVGRLDRQKGIDVLLRAVKDLSDQVALRIIGDSVADGDALSLAAYPHVSALGWQKMPEVAAHMQACDVVVMPSRWEGLPLVALEAMRLSKPVIGADVGGMGEVIQDGETGFLFPVEDHNKLRQLLLGLNTEQCAIMGAKAQQRFMDHFTADRVCAEVTALYEKVLAIKQQSKG